MPVPKMLILPADPGSEPPAPATLADCLQKAGLIAAPLDCNGRQIWPTGPAFLQLITFMGCSPAIELDPPGDASQLASACSSAAFCHIVLDHFDTLQFRHDHLSARARCPHCGKPAANWRALVSHWHQDPAAAWQCAHCARQAPVPALDFRKTGGFGRVFIEIRGIHPAEAVPVDALLDKLHALSGYAWRYLYVQD